MTAYTARAQSRRYDVEFNGKTFRPEPGVLEDQRGVWSVSSSADRICDDWKHAAYMRYFDDFPVYPTDEHLDGHRARAASDERSSTSSRQHAKVIERCILMTTDPGDLVLDPTCGSGTTAYVAEQWGRRWITIDTSRVPLALARQRLLTATFPY